MSLSLFANIKTGSQTFVIIIIFIIIVIIITIIIIIIIIILSLLLQRSFMVAPNNGDGNDNSYDGDKWCFIETRRIYITPDRISN